MISGISASVTALNAYGKKFQSTANNTANIDTDGYKRLRHVLEVVEHDSWELFVDMHRYNPFAAERRQAFMAVMQALDEELTQ